MEIIADSMLIIDRGRKVVEGKVSELLNPKETNVEVETTNVETSMEQIQNSIWAKHFDRILNGKIILKMDSDKIPQFIRDISQMKIDIISVRQKHSLEDYFLSLTAHQHVPTFKN
jgi:ABC-type multidrug transport system ATPase subunit